MVPSSRPARLSPKQAFTCANRALVWNAFLATPFTRHRRGRAIRARGFPPHGSLLATRVATAANQESRVKRRRTAWKGFDDD